MILVLRLETILYLTLEIEIYQICKIISALETTHYTKYSYILSIIILSSEYSEENFQKHTQFSKVPKPLSVKNFTSLNYLLLSFSQDRCSDL